MEEGTYVVNGFVNVNGELSMQNGTHTVNGNVTVRGSITMMAGTFSVNGSVVMGGAVQLNGEITVVGDVVLAEGATMTRSDVSSSADTGALSLSATGALAVEVGATVDMDRKSSYKYNLKSASTTSRGVQYPSHGGAAIENVPDIDTSPTYGQVDDVNTMGQQRNGTGDSFEYGAFTMSVTVCDCQCG